MVENAIIGGTGVYNLDGNYIEEEIKTPYGEVNVYVQKIGQTEIAFLPRHGKGHSVPPHMINYRANIKALEQLGVKRILATAAVGSLNYDYPPGSLMVLEQFIDFTKHRTYTFFDGNDGVAHVDMADPYCIDLIEAVEKGSKRIGINIGEKGTYVCVEGPRFETKAEIQFFKSIGGDMVGMTNIPEVVLARELGMCYGAVGIVTNWCNGMVDERISHGEIRKIMQEGREQLLKLFIHIFTDVQLEGRCRCRESIVRL